MTIGDRLRALRLAMGLTQDEVGKVLGFTRHTYFKYEAGYIKSIPLKNIEKLAAFFSVSPAYLCGWEKVQEEEGLGLTAEERRLVESFRQLDSASREVVFDLIEARLARLRKQARE